MILKKGVLIYRAPPSFGRDIIVGAVSLDTTLFTEISKADKFIEKLNEELADSGSQILVEKDDTEADLEEIASRKYDFILCAPGLEEKVYAQDNLPPIYYMESLEYHNLLVSKTVQNIKASLR